jgi:hypothetical protein
LLLAAKTHPIAGDTAFVILSDVFRALPKAQGMSPRGKFTIAVWATLVVMLPRTVERRLILWRFVPAARPQVLRRALSRLGLIR